MCVGIINGIMLGTAVTFWQNRFRCLGNKIPCFTICHLHTVHIYYSLPYQMEARQNQDKIAQSSYGASVIHAPQSTRPATRFCSIWLVEKIKKAQFSGHEGTRHDCTSINNNIVT